MAPTFRVGRHEVPARPWISPTVSPGPAPGKGRGLFAAVPIPAGEVVLVWGGESYVDAAGAEQARSRGLATMQWDQDLFSHETPRLPVAFAINHSCDPNVWLRDAFTLTARRDITAGEELAIDYATMMDDAGDLSDGECRCGSPRCRGRVTGADWRLEALRRRYRGHFTPWLARRIEEDG